MVVESEKSKQVLEFAYFTSLHFFNMNCAGLATSTCATVLTWHAGCTS
jgi:hypothetical protein